MTRLLTTGWETGDVAEAGIGTIGANTTHTVVNATPTPRAGAYCFKLGFTSASPASSFKSLALPAAKTEVWVRFAFMAHGLGPSNEPYIALLTDATGTAQCSITYTASDGLLRAYRGSSTTLLATAGTAFPQDEWHVIEWRTLISTTTTGTTEVWLDGNLVLTFSGDNSATATLNVQTLRLGLSSAVGLSAATIGGYLAFDDLAVNDVAGTRNNARPGDGRVVMLLPNGVGTTTQFVRGGTDTGANYSQVNEQPASMTQYVSSATVGERDLYAIQNLAVAVSAINVVEVVSLTQNSDAGAGNIAHTLRSGGTNYDGASIGLATTAGFVRTQWETNPSGSVAWTAAAVDALEAGAIIQ